ncbi:MAG TPA: oligosaccharide flippase family protein [Sphingomonas sp.]|uniref:lipopolysaccharide biosynthesis protein n=1 Tax=Sphingomonas sp. TaxID=28214 RepID=UPI002B6929A5|nr:oligosaccharide flippase family protein [Sphingomonas sp.]HMI18859.1 oligosaccharide flippase family protein [Sphingomonas sp.]
MPDSAARGLVARIYGNLIKLLSGKAAAALLGLAYMVIATRALGPTDYGILVLVHGFAMTVGGIVEFPGWHAIVRYGAQALAEDDHPRMLRLLRFAGLVEGVGGIASILAAAILAPLIGPALGWSPTAIAFALPYSFAVLASIRATPAGYLQLLGRFDLLGLHNIVAPAVRLIGALIVAWLGLGLKGFLVAWLIAALAEWSAMWLLGVIAIRRTLRDPALLGSVRGAVAENPGLWRFMLAANADVTLTELAARIAPLFVGWILGPAAAGLYAVAQRATVVIQQPAQIMGQAAYAELARLVAGGGSGAALRTALLRCAGVALAAATPVLIILMLFGRQIAVALGGHAFAGAAGLILLLAIARTAWLVAPPASSALTALGRPTLSVAANLAINLGLLPLLPLMMLAFGLEGSGWHAIIQGAGASVVLLLMVFHQTRKAALHEISV